MKRLNIGCGPNCFPGWLNIDRIDQSGYLHAMATAGRHDGWPDWQRRLAEAARVPGAVTCSVWDLRDGFTGSLFEEGTVDCVYLGQMIEHLNVHYEVPKFLKDCFRMLKPGGAIRVTTPNLLVLLDRFHYGKLDDFESDQPAFFGGASPADQLCYLMYGASGPDCSHDNYEGHFHLYTPHTLQQRLEAAGFTKVRCVCSEDRFETDYPELFGDVVDQGMSYAFAMEAKKP